MKGRKSKTSYVVIPELTADPFIVKQFADHLLAAFQQFIDEYPGNVDHVDGFMAAHNFHRVVVERLVVETGTPVWFDLAVGTFVDGVERAGVRMDGGEEAT